MTDVPELLRSTFITYGSPDDGFARKRYEALHANGGACRASRGRGRASGRRPRVAPNGCRTTGAGHGEAGPHGHPAHRERTEPHASAGPEETRRAARGGGAREAETWNGSERGAAAVVVLTDELDKLQRTKLPWSTSRKR